MEYEAVIGLEVHVQLKTESKMFTRAAYQYGDPPNTLTNPVVMGLPGTLPVMNKAAIEKTILVGLMLGCEIAEECKWDRKNYFYPDQPKNYQISQFDKPLCLGGKVEIELPGSSRNIMGTHRDVILTRIHLEEDVGKLTHFETESLVDYNRAGAALMELVTEPDMHNADEVFAFLTSLRMALIYGDISDCDMEKGQLRCDANISVRPKGSEKLGEKVELKNMNSISGVRNGVEYEIKRQTKALKNNERIVQETRRWNAESCYTISMRSKEEAHDYRYFPDPDLMPVKVSEEWRNKIAESKPEMPYDKQRRFFDQYDLPFTATSVICPDHKLSTYFEDAVKFHNNPKQIANFIANDLQRELSEAGVNGVLPLSDCKITPIQIAALVKLIDDGTISKQIGQDVFSKMFKSGEDPDTIIDRDGLRQSSDTGEIEKFCQEAIDNNPKPVAQYKEGKVNAINALKGQVMKATRGKANPALVDKTLRELLA